MIMTTDVITSDLFCLDPAYSTTRLVTRETPIIKNPPDAKFETVPILPEGEGRKGEGGLRIQGYFKKGLPGKPLITVITVVFNGEKHLEDTILSVLNQMYDNVEYIIIDGGSTDGTVDIIRKYDGQIDYWVSEKDEGIYDAMNKGWQHANNDGSILFLGSGDKFLSLPRNIDSRTILYGNVIIGDKLFKSSLGYQLKAGNTLHHQALLVPKIFSITPPFDIRFPVYADFDFNQRLYRKGCAYKYCDDFLGYALPDGASAKLDILQMSSVTKKNFGIIAAAFTLLYCTYQKVRHEI